MPVLSVTAERILHPLHAILLAFPVALSWSAVASDIAYLNSAVIQWSNFAAWLLAGTALFSGFVLICAIAAFVCARRSAQRGRALVYLVVVVVMWAISVLNSFHHARDGWGSVGTLGLVLSIVTALLALAAAWIAYSAPPAVIMREPVR